MKRVKRIIVLLLAVTMLVGINTSYVDARDGSSCDHYGVKFDEKTCTFRGTPETVNCSYGIPHPCYVGGILVSCQTHYYTKRVALSCNKCRTFLYYVYFYEEYHQYNHSN